MNEPLFSRIQTSFIRQRFLGLIGAELEAVDVGQVTISCQRREDLTQQQGLLHGGVVMTLADVTCGYAALTVMAEDREVLTVESKINLLRPAAGERFTAVGTVLKAGRSLIVTEATVTDLTTGKAVAKMLATMIPSPIPTSDKAKKEGTL